MYVTHGFRTKGQDWQQVSQASPPPPGARVQTRWRNEVDMHVRTLCIELLIHDTEKLYLISSASLKILWQSS